MKTAKSARPPQRKRVNRSGLRQRQSAILKMAKGRTVVEVASRGKDEEKCILDKAYFDELVSARDAAVETLEILTDQKLYSRLLKTAGTLSEDVRKGKLASLEEVFGEG